MPVKTKIGFPDLPNAALPKSLIESPSVIFIQEVKWSRAILFILIRERDNDISAFRGRLHLKRSESSVHFELLNDQRLQHHLA